MSRTGQSIWWIVLSVAVAMAVYLYAMAAHADPAKPPVQSNRIKLSPLHSAQLDRDLAHIREIQRAAEQQAKPYTDEIAKILDTYKIPAAEFGKTITFDVATGDLVKTPPKP